MRHRPNLFVIGAAKSGTTSLHEYLDGHPDIYMSPVKEPRFFAPDVPPSRQRFKYMDNLEDYLDLFDAAGEETVLGESTTSYLFSRKAPALIRAFAPEARIVAILRNPADMAFSLHGHRVAHGDEPIADFAEALAADERSDLGGVARKSLVERAGTYLQRARYADQLELWLETFPREQIHILIFEEFIGDYGAEFRPLLQFLNVDPTYTPATFVARNARHSLRRGRLADALRSRPSKLLRHRVLPSLLGVSRTARLGRRIGEGPILREKAKKQSLDENLRQELQLQLADDVERLSAMLGRDMRTVWWRDVLAQQAQAQGT